MLNVKSDRWLKIFRCYTIIMSILLLALGVVMGIFVLDEGCMITHEESLDALIFIVSGIAVAFVHYSINMLILQFFNNVQIIRKKIEGDTVQ